MEQIVDQLLAVALVFLLLSLVVKGIQDIVKFLFDNKEKVMQQIVNDIKKYRNVEDVYIYFNNDIEVAAVRNAKKIMEIANVSLQHKRQSAYAH